MCGVPEKSDAGFSSLLHHDREICLRQALTWVAPRESPLVPMDGGDFVLTDRGRWIIDREKLVYSLRSTVSKE